MEAGFPAIVSEDAGNYVCNATYYRSLRARHAKGRVVGFVHVPPEGKNGLTRESPASRHDRAEGRIARMDGASTTLSRRPADHPASGSMR